MNKINKALLRRQFKNRTNKFFVYRILCALTVQIDSKYWQLHLAKFIADTDGN